MFSAKHLASVQGRGRGLKSSKIDGAPWNLHSNPILPLRIERKWGGVWRLRPDRDPKWALDLTPGGSLYSVRRMKRMASVVVLVAGGDTDLGTCRA